MKSDAYSPVGAGVPGFAGYTTETPVEKYVLKPAVRTSEFWGLQGGAVLPWVADLFSSAPIPMWIKLVITAGMQVALALARAWPKSRLGAVLDKLPLPAIVAATTPPAATLPTSSPTFNPMPEKR